MCALRGIGSGVVAYVIVRVKPGNLQTATELFAELGFTAGPVELLVRETKMCLLTKEGSAAIKLVSEGLLVEPGGEEGGYLSFYVGEPANLAEDLEEWLQDRGVESRWMLIGTAALVDVDILDKTLELLPAP